MDGNPHSSSHEILFCWRYLYLVWCWTLAAILGKAVGLVVLRTIPMVCGMCGLPGAAAESDPRIGTALDAFYSFTRITNVDTSRAIVPSHESYIPIRINV